MCRDEVFSFLFVLFIPFFSLRYRLLYFLWLADILPLFRFGFVFFLAADLIEKLQFGTTEHVNFVYDDEATLYCILHTFCSLACTSLIDNRIQRDFVVFFWLQIEQRLHFQRNNYFSSIFVFVSFSFLGFGWHLATIWDVT